MQQGVSRSERNDSSDQDSEKIARVFPKSWGAEFIREGAARFRIWAPAVPSLGIDLGGETFPMGDIGNGWYEFFAEGMTPGTRYNFILPDGTRIADPASRGQVGGAGGASLLIDPTSYRWSVPDWQGRPFEEAVIYELHVGTFTQEGTFRAAIDRLDHLQEIGITAVEIMPVGQFPGNRGWGYDVVLPYAPHEAYGSPEEMKAFIDAAHHRGMIVFLDVIYNHFGPSNNYLPVYAPSFFVSGEPTPWGAAFDYSQDAVRRFVCDNALYWLEEYNLDGLRLDAIEQIRDPHSEVHILTELSRRVRNYFDRPRHLVVEDQKNTARLLEAEAEGHPRLYDGCWNDDFHHVAHVIASGEKEANYEGFHISPGKTLAKALSEGFIRQGQAFAGRDTMQCGEPSAHLSPQAFVNFIQNHDQIGNRPFGDRLDGYAAKEKVQLLTAVLLLSPGIPLLFMGQELGTRRPFRFFCDLPELADKIIEGRFPETQNFGPLPDATLGPEDLPDPNDPKTFEASKLDWSLADEPAAQERMRFIADLIETRARHVTPGLVPDLGGTGRVIEASDDHVAVDWRLADRTLGMRINLSHQPVALPELKGTTIYRFGDFDKEARERFCLPPFSMACSVDLAT